MPTLLGVTRTINPFRMTGSPQKLLSRISFLSSNLTAAFYTCDTSLRMKFAQLMTPRQIASSTTCSMRRR
jgi:hypothetical protein